MSFLSRITNVLRGDRLSRDIAEELESHIQEAIEQGRDPSEARKALGSALYGVLDYSVLQRRHEIAIRMAIGAPAGDIARRVAIDVFGMVVVGGIAGLALGMASVRYIESLLYQVKATDLGMLMLPSLAILAAALLTALPPVIRAVRIDPARTLRAE